MTAALLSLTELIKSQVQTSSQREEAFTQLIQQQADISSQREDRLLGMAQAAAQAKQSDPSAARPKLPASAAPPPRLTSGASLREFAVWKERLEDYNMLTGVKHLSPPEQRASLSALLDDEWHRIVKYGLGLSDTATTKDVTTAMETHLRDQRNVILDRREFYTRNQELDESFDEYLIALKEISEFCNFCTSCSDERLRDRIVTGLRDEDTVRALLSEKKLTLQRTVELCRAREHAHANASAIASGQVNAMSIDRRSRRRDDSPTYPHGDPNKKCGYCGGPPHPDGQRRQCPARGHRCTLCGILHHYASVCRRGSQSHRNSRPQLRNRSPSSRRARQQDRQSPDYAAARVTSLHVRGLSSRRTPQVRIQVQHRSRSCSMLWTPDTGAEISAMGIRQARSLGADLSALDRPPERILGADGHELQCSGSLQCQMKLGEVIASITVCIIPAMDGALLSWYDSISLGLLPRSFPCQITGNSPPPHAVLQSPADISCDVVIDSLVAEADAEDQDESSAVNAPLLTPPPRSTQQDSRPVRSMYPVWDDKNGDPTPQQRAEHLAMLQDIFPRVFDTTGPLREMSGGPMKIELQDDAQPFAITAARAIPFAYRDQAKRQLDKLVEDGVIVEVTEPTPWCHPTVFVPKKAADGSKDPANIRVCVDLTQLNAHVRRGAHPTRSPEDVVTNIPSGSRFFTKLDAKNGYFQIPIAQEHQSYTTFITPWGRFKHVRAPMGLSSSNDEYNRRVDAVLSGIPRTLHVVDDILVHDSSYSAHLTHVIEVLERCDANGITLSPSKLQFASSSVDFCGYRLSPAGYTADDRKVRAIAEFPVPQHITDLRAFMGLVNQLGSFSDETASAAHPLRDLLKPRNLWQWTEVHQRAFEAVKRTLTRTPVLAYFDASRPTALHTDATRLHGLGYCLLQHQQGHWKLIQCGSRFVTDVESRYAAVELEMLAVTLAIRKCRLFLAGLPSFDVVTDHRPLIPILNQKSLAEIENPRLQRLREKLLPYNFSAVWKSGKTHCIPDALSRSPVDDPAIDDEDAENDEHHFLQQAVVASIREISAEDAADATPDATLDRVRIAARADADYLALIATIRDGFPDQRADLPVTLRGYWGVRNALTVDNDLALCGTRLIIPHALRRDTLSQLHASHQGMDRTKRRARQTVFWPGINQDINNVVSSCDACRKYLPSLPKEPLMADNTPTRVFETASADFFHHAGKTFLVVADRLSGWPVIAASGREATARTLVRNLREIFALVGVPQVLKSDGGPQFTARHTKEFLRRWGVTHRITSPHYPAANGHAEASVKAVKRLIQKSTVNGDLDSDAYAMGLLELRNTPRADGRSPAEVLYGHPLRTAVPVHHKYFANTWQERADECDQRAQLQAQKATDRYNVSAHPLSSLRIGQHVCVQHHATGLWDRIGTIVAIGRRRTYLVKMPSGRVLWRNRRFLRPYRPLTPVPEHSHAAAPTLTEPDQPGSTTASPTTSPRRAPPETPHQRRTVRFSDEPVMPRRSTRTRRPPEVLQVDPHRQSYVPQ